MLWHHLLKGLFLIFCCEHNCIFAHFCKKRSILRIFVGLCIFENGFGNRNKNRLDDYGLGSHLLLLKMYSSLNVSFFDLFLKRPRLIRYHCQCHWCVCLINQGLITELYEARRRAKKQILDLQFWPSCQSWIQFVLSELFNYCRFNRLGELGEVSLDML